MVKNTYNSGLKLIFIKYMFRKLIRSIRRVFSWFRLLGVVQVLTILLIIVSILILVSVTGNDVGVIEENNLKVVEIRSVAALSSNAEPLSVIGRVESQSEADIRAEAQGEITRTYVTLGDKVFAGQVLAQTENASQRASLLQAEGLFEAAEANLLKLTSGSRGEEQDILFLTVDQAENKLEQSKVSALNTLNNSFSVVDDILFSKVDVLFNNPRAERPQLGFTVSDQDLETQIEDGRANIGRMLEDWEINIKQTTTESDLITELNSASSNLVTMRTFINDVARAVNTTEANADISTTEVTTRRANMLAARSSINTTIGTIAAEINALNASVTALEVSKKNKEIGIVGGRSEDVLAAEASLKQAQGSLAGARASYEKTVIRTPITGTLNSFPIKKGSFVSLYQPVAVVSNNNALEVTAFITEDDRNQVSTGSTVLIDGRYDGVITSIAPALDPLTKKIEVNITPRVIPELLVNGSSVRVEIERDVRTADIDSSLPITIPISALKIEPDKKVIFVVDNANTLIAHTVVLGPIVGEKVVIAEGLTQDMTIVTDARGLKEGQIVEIK